MKCCPQNKKQSEKRGFWAGIVYGLIPHLGCIAFIAFSVLGATTATALFKPLLLNRYFFHLLIIISIIFATISAIFHFKKQGFISWQYLLTLYGTTIFINLLLFMVIFPLAANLQPESSLGTAVKKVLLQVDIPCPGHAPLIIGELKGINGVGNVKFRFPNLFDVDYDPKKTSEEKILALTVFETYKAGEADELQPSSNPGSCGCGCGK